MNHAHHNINTLQHCSQNSNHIEYHVYSIKEVEQSMTETNSEEQFRKTWGSRLKIILLLSCGLMLTATHSVANDMMLPQVYSEQVNVSGWVMSEKLDGVRGYWDGKQLL